MFIKFLILQEKNTSLISRHLQFCLTNVRTLTLYEVGLDKIWQLKIENTNTIR